MDEKDKTPRHVLRSNRIPFSSGTKLGGGCYTVEARWAHTATVIGKRIYIFGGQGENCYSNTCIFDTTTSVWSEVNTVGKGPISRYGHSATLITMLPTSRATAAITTTTIDEQIEQPTENNSKILIFGGKGKKHLNDLCSLDLRTMTWSTYQLDKHLPDSRAAHSFTFIPKSNKVVLFGGYNSSRYYNSLYILELQRTQSDSIKWNKPTNIRGTPPSARSAHTANYITEKGALIIFGGFDGKRSLNDIFLLDISTKNDQISWQPIKTTGITPLPRHGHTSVIVKNKYLVVHGGYSTQGDQFLNDIHILDLDQFQWISQPTITGFTLFPRFHHTSSLLEVTGEMFIFGGCSSGVLYSDVCSVDLKPLLNSQTDNTLSIPLNNLNNNNNNNNNNNTLKTTTTTTTTTTSPILNTIQISNNLEDQQQQQQQQNDNTSLPTPPSPNLNNHNNNNIFNIYESKIRILENQLSNTLTLLTSEQNQKLQINEELNKLKMLNSENEVKLVDEKSKLKSLEKEHQRFELVIKKEQSFKTKSKEQLTKLNSTLKDKDSQLQLFTEIFSQFKLKDSINLIQVPSYEKRETFSNFLKTLPQLPTPNNINNIITVNNTSIVNNNNNNNNSLSSSSSSTTTTTPPSNTPSSSSIITSLEIENQQLKIQLQKTIDLQKEYENDILQIRSRFPKLKLQNLIGESLDDLDIKDLDALEELYHESLKQVGKSKQKQMERKLQKMENHDNNNLCKVCLDHEINIVFLPCKHRCVCSQCSTRLSTCPLCRSIIKDKIEYY